MTPTRTYRTVLRRVQVIGVTVLMAGGAMAEAQTGANVLVVINSASAASGTIGHQYSAKRDVPQENICEIALPVTRTVSRAVYAGRIELPIWKCISTNRAHDRILYIVLTKDVPIRIAGTGGRSGTMASVDSELTLLYRRRTGLATPAAGFIPNPYFAGTTPIESIQPFSHKSHDIYLVTRLDGDTVQDALALIDRASAATAEGHFALSAAGANVEEIPQRWLRSAAERLSALGLGTRVASEQTSTMTSTPSQLLGYFGWSWQDATRAGAIAPEFLPGALAGLFVSTDGPRRNETPAPDLGGPDPRESAAAVAASASPMADLIRAGVTGVAGNVEQPYLDATVRPDILFPSYASGRNLAEAFYAALPYLSWQTVIIGDPLCAPFPHAPLTTSQLDPPTDTATELPASFALRVMATLTQTLSRDAASAFLRFQSRSLGNDTVGARQALNAAIVADPRFTAARMQLALLSDRAGDYDQAIAQYRAIISFSPNDATALNNLAYLLTIARNEPRQALPFAERAILAAKVAPELLGTRLLANYTILEVTPPELLIPYSLDTLAWVQHLLGHSADAAKTIRESRAAGGASPEILWHAAVIYASVNDLSRAAVELSAAIASDPSLMTRAEIRKLRLELITAASTRSK